MSKAIDVVVIGAGPAGLAAARIVAEAGLSCAAIDRTGPGGQLMNMGEVQDWPDLEPGATGPDLLAAMVEAAMAAGAEFVVDEVTRIAGKAPGGNGEWTVEALDSTWQAKAVVVATGLEKGTTGVADEARFDGLGLSHCAQCDGPLYGGQRIVVAGCDRWAAEEAIALAAMVEHVTLVVDTPTDTLDAEVRARLESLDNAGITEGSIVGLEGPVGLESVLVATTSGVTAIPASGLFVFTGRRPATAILGNHPALTATGHMRPASERSSDLLACGDVRDGAVNSLQQAIADGVEAGHNAVRLVRERAGKT